MDILISALVWIISSSITIAFFPISVLIWFLTYPFDSRRTAMHWWLVFQASLLSGIITLWTIKVEGREKAKKGTRYVIISNHQSLLDILVLNCLWYRFRWISKIENYKVPVIGWYLRMAKYIAVDRGNKESKAEMMELASASLRKGVSIMMFPEGTRSPDREIGPFKLGAFQLAMMTDKPILPVIVDGTGGVLPKHGLLISSGHHIRIRVLDPVHPGSFGTADPEALAAKFRDLMIGELKKLREEN
jgi:1-acyl-sn-glycerol-3-phosphate acyltransferase